MTELPKPPDLDINLIDLTPSEKGDKEGSQKSRPIEEIYADLEAISRTMKESVSRIGDRRSDTAETDEETENDDVNTNG